MSTNDDEGIPEFLSPYPRPPEPGASDKASLRFGELHSLSDAGSQVRQKALVLFLQAIDLVAPKVKQSLIDDVRPLYQRADCLSDQDHWIRNYGELQLLINEKRASISDTELHDGLCSWAKTHNLNNLSEDKDVILDVILDAALYTLWSWTHMEPLYRDVLPFFRPVASKLGPFIVGEQVILTGGWNFARFAETRSPEVETLISKLASWLKQHKRLYQNAHSGSSELSHSEITDRVLRHFESKARYAEISEAIRQLDLWSFPRESDWREWFLPYSIPQFRSRDHDFTFTIFGWFPEIESKSLAEKRIRGKFEAELENYLSQSEQKLKEVDWTSAPERLLEVHFKWLALRQVLGMTYADIARKYEPLCDDKQVLASECKKVSNSVKLAAELVAGPSWKDWLKKSEAGRPPKTK